MLGAMTSLTGGGGLSGGAATNGDFKGGETAFGGDNFNFGTPAWQSKDAWANPMVWLGVAAVVGLVLWKRS